MYCLAKPIPELLKLIKTADQNAGYICDVVTDCAEILEAESSDVFLFFSLGQCLEQLDQQLRLGEDTTRTLCKIDYIVDTLCEIGWGSVKQYWTQLRAAPDLKQFYQFSDHIHRLFEADV